MTSARTTILKLALVVERLEPAAGGAERSTLEVADELIRRGHQVTVVVGRCPQGMEVPGGRVLAMTHTARSGARWLGHFARWAGAQLRQGDFDLTLSFTTAVPAHVIEPWGGTVRETLLRNVALRRSSVARCWKRLSLALTLKHRVALALERRALTDGNVRRVVALSHYVARQLAQHYALPAERIAVVPNAVALPLVDEAQRQAWRHELRAGFHISPRSVVFLFAAMNPRLKGFESLLQAAARLAGAEQDFTILLAGRMNYAEQALAARLGVREHLRFVGLTQHMAQVYCGADVTVLPTFYDPSSRVVIESLRLGVPAISTRFNGASDFIDDGHAPRCGRVIADPLDTAVLATAMREMMDAGERARCAQAALALGDVLAIPRHVDQLEALLLGLAGQSKANAPAAGARNPEAIPTEPARPALPR